MQFEEDTLFVSMEVRDRPELKGLMITLTKRG